VTQKLQLHLGAVPAFVAFAALLGLAGRAESTIPEVSLGAAAVRLQAGDAEGAARLLELIVTREPQNGRAWRMLGTARQGVKNLDGAIEAWTRAIEVDPSVPTPYYSIGVAYAASHDAERAFEFLGKARATRKIDMTQIEASPELAPFRSDPRFAALRPEPKDFEDAFVEPTHVIREWDGEAANDQFGWIARKLGDVDGDGIPDVVVSAPTSGAGGEKAGRVYVYSTKTGALVWTTVGHAGDELGTGVENAGDVNGDGIPDVIASAPGGGFASVFSGRDGRVLWTFKAEATSDDFGRHVSGVGDVDRDGHADVIVGAPKNAAGGKGAGRAYVYSGKTGRALLTLTGEHPGDGFGSAVAGYSDRKLLRLVVGAPTAGARHGGRVFVYSSLQPKPQFVVDADETGGALGAMFLSVLGDVDGDGVPDVYASDWSNGANGPSTGRVYVHSGRDGHRLFALTGETAGEGFGTSPSVAGDVDGDGHADLIVGAWQHSSAAVGGGRAYLYSGKDGRLIKTYTCRTPGDTFGFDAVGMGDVDGDGTMDFLITSGWSGVHGFHSGRVFIISSGVTRAR
jgi:FG-GAP repeat/FG-GAP-like repeat/TPR repeat